MSAPLFKTVHNLYSILDLKQICKVSRNKLTNLIDIFDIPCIKNGKHKFYDDESLKKIQELLNREDYFKFMLEQGALKRCGYKHYNQDPKKKLKIKESMLSKYGVSSAFELASVRNKCIETLKSLECRSHKGERKGFVLCSRIRKNLELTENQLRNLLKYYKISDTLLCS